MRGFPRRERRWASDTVDGRGISAGSSPRSDAATTTGDEELVEVTLDFQDDDTIVLRSVEPATAIDFDLHDFGGDGETTATATPVSTSRSPSMRRSSSHRLRQFSQELKAEAVARARQFSQELKAELRRFSWSHGHASRTLSSSSGGQAAGVGGAVTDARLAARALRRQRAQLDRTRSGAQKALRGLRFISSTGTGAVVDSWNEIQKSFEKLSRDGFLHRSDFAQCIGSHLTSLY